MSVSKLAQLQELLRKGISTKVFAGAQLAVVDPGGNTLFVEAGREWSPHQAPEHYLGPPERGGPPIARTTLFDVASLTKTLVTASLAMQLVDRGSLSFDTPIQRFLPALPEDDGTQIGHLLAHSSGLPAWHPFHETHYRPDHTWSWNRDHIRRACLAMDKAPCGSAHCYSDIGYILLHWIIETVAQRSLDELATERLFEPAGLELTRFRNSPRRITRRCGNRRRFAAAIEGADLPFAATERCAVRDRVVYGEVHDWNAWAMGGVAGHAGLFSTAQEVLTLFRALFGELPDESPALIDTPTMEAALDRDGPFRRGSHVLGWDTPSGPRPAAGSLMDLDATIGHLGFTGCSIWSDRSNGLTVVLLSNRIHPLIDNDRIKKYRPWFHDQVVEVVGGREDSTKWPR